jgi:DNA-binding GntR family transcriptional regulator
MSQASDEDRVGPRGESGNAGPLLKQRSNLALLAREEIQRRISDGDLKEGDRINIDKLAREFGTSQIPVREALAGLLTQRAVTFEPYKGYRVAPGPHVDELRSMFEARLVLEVGALEISGPKITPEVISHLRYINAQIDLNRHDHLKSSSHRIIVLNEQFHRRILEASGNAIIVKAYEDVGYHQRIGLALKAYEIADIEQIVDEHNRIIAALTAGDFEATVKSLRQHITNGADRILTLSENEKLAAESTF